MGGGSTPNSTENRIKSTQNNKITQDSTPNCIKSTSQNNTTKNNITKCYEPKNEQTLLELLGYTREQITTFQEFLKYAVSRKIGNFWWAWQGMIDFRFLREINLCFYEGIIHEDHLFGAFLFAQSGVIAIIPQKLYNYRIRKGSTMSAWSKDEIPSYVKPFCAHFPYKKARMYFRIYSLVISVQGLMEFAKTHFVETNLNKANPDKNSDKNSILQDLQKHSQKQSDLNKIQSNFNQTQNDFLALTLPLLLEIICEIFYFYKDPYNLKAQTAKIIKDLGVDCGLLPRKIKERANLYSSPILCKYIWAIIYVEKLAISMKDKQSEIYQYCKTLERRFRHWRRGI